MDFSIFNNKYVIKGKLTVLTALHIGSGKEKDGHDAPFMSDEDGLFYIPGSSFRGYLSTKLERILEKENNFELIEKNTGKSMNMADVKLLFGYTNLDSEKDENIIRRVKEKLNIKKELETTKKLSLQEEAKEFNSMAGRIHISDMIIESEVKEIKRDGIKIDRNTGATEEKGKFDYDVIPSGSKFNFTIEIENVEDYQLELLGLALKDMVEDGDLFGGKLSRGIGKCIILKKDLKIEYVDSKNKEALKDYIFKKKMLTKDISSLFDIKNIDLKLK